MTATTFIYTPPKLLRRSRRTTWRCSIRHQEEDRFRRAVAIHIAAHAVALHDLAIQLVQLSVDVRHATGTLEAEWQSLKFPVHDVSVDARRAVEDDCMAIHAGIVAKSFALGWEHTNYGWDDQELAWDLLQRIEYDDCLRTSWHQYQRERARCLVGDPWMWTRIERLAARFTSEPTMDGARVAECLRDVERERLVVPARIAWRTPPPAEPSNVVLVWQKPGLTEIVERSRVLATVDEGDDR